jgi:hypothetical protein
MTDSGQFARRRATAPGREADGKTSAGGGSLRSLEKRRKLPWSQRPLSFAPPAALETKAERQASRSAISSVDADAPNFLNSWLPDQGSNLGPAD